MESKARTARLAGLLYLLMALPAFFSLIYVRTRLFVRGDASQTASNILSSESLFRAGIVGILVSAIFFMFLAMALYSLLKSVDRRLAMLLLILVLVQIPLAFLNEVSSLAALVVLHGADFLSGFDARQVDALATLFLKINTQGHVVAELFWGLWLFPFGILVYRSGFIPRILGVFLIVNGFAYPALSFTGILWPQHYSTVLRAVSPALLGELAILLWLLIVGARSRPLGTPASAPLAG